jgi:hypothetical protein
MDAATLPGGDLDGGLPGHVGHEEVHGEVLAVHQFVHHISEHEKRKMVRICLL